MTDIEEIKEIELNMLVEIDKVCKKHNIQYSLSSGTLLGAVRHGGFIPWDDDIDIVMTMDNYNKFLSVAQAELPEHLFVENYKTEQECPFLYTKIVDTTTTFVDGAYQYLNTAKGVSLDVFVVTGMREKDKKKKEKLYRWTIMFISKHFDKKNISISWKHKLLNIILPKVKPCKILKHYFEQIDKFDKKGKEITNGDFLSDNKIFDYSLFTEYTDMEFEGHNFMCIKNYDEYLRIAYGDYMQLPPEDQREPHHDYLYFNAHKPYKEYLLKQKYKINADK